MNLSFPSYAVLLCTLLILIVWKHVDGSRALTDGIDKENTNVLHLHSMDVHAHHHSSHMNHMKSSEIVFFKMEDLKIGKTMPIFFPRTDPSKSPQLLRKEKADKIPFSLQQLPNILQYFSFSQDSPQARSMKYTLEQCENKPLEGETKICATSFKSMHDFTHAVLGEKIEVLYTSHLNKSNTLVQNYKILEDPEAIEASNMVACHKMAYPYAVFYCHYQESENRIYKVSLVGENGERVDAISVCHLDTSQWSSAHPSFRVLGIEPGTSPVCHFFRADNYVWIPSRTY